MGDGGFDAGDDITGAVHHDVVAHAQVAAGDVGRVVQGGVSDGGAVDLDRLKDRAGCDDAGAAHVPLHLEQPGDLLDGRQLVGDRPARGARPGAGGLLVGGQVGLDDDPVDAERQLRAQGCDLLHPGQDLLGGVGGDTGHGRGGGGVHPVRGRLRHEIAVRELAQPGRQRCVGVGKGEHAVAEERHRHGVRAVLGAQSARRGVARIGKRLPAMCGAHLIGVFELSCRHQDFAAHLHGDRLGEFLGQALDGADRVRDVLPGRPVASRDQLSQAATGVAGGDREPVEFRLHAEAGDVAADAPGQGCRPGGELLGREHIVQAQHRHRVRDIALHGTAGHLARR